jgi:crossover junction endodeoxyribonuclease RuvC
MKIIGIDPGQTGALAVMQAGKIATLLDMPTIPRLHGKGQQVDGYALSSWLLEQVAGDDVKVVIEAVAARPGQGVSSMFRFGEALGVVLGVCGALTLPVQWVRPAQWKRQAGLLGKDKDAARTLATQLHPEVANMLTRKRDIGRADAICIAHFVVFR